MKNVVKLPLLRWSGKGINLILAAFFTLINFVAIAQAPANDNCGSATLVTSTLVNCSSPVNGTLNNATMSLPQANGGSPCLAWANGYDVWYRFTAASTTQTITTSNFGGNYWNRQLFLYSSCPATEVGAGFIACGTTSITTTTLTAGNTYYVRVSESWTPMTSNGGFTICVTHPLTSTVNNTCATAFPISSGPATCSPTTAHLLNANAAAPSGPAGVCATGTPYDVWFSFTASLTAQTIKVDNLGSSVNPATTYVEVFSGACGSLTSLGCQQVSSGLMPATGLTVGATYFVRVYRTSNPNTGPLDNWRFNICVGGAPVNDECASAILATSTLQTCTAPVSGSLNYATTSLPQADGSSPCTLWAYGYDVWYKFVAASSTQTITTSGFGGNYWNRQLFLYSSCPTSEVGAGYIACGTTAITRTDLVAGNTYYIRVSDSWNFITAGGEFTLCITHPLSASVNNTCATSYTLASNTSCVATTGNLLNANTGTPGPVCTIGNTYDVWFNFSATATSQTITLSNLGSSLTASDTYFEVFSGSCAGLTSISCQPVSSGRLTLNSLTIGVNYYIRVYVRNNPNAGAMPTWNFDICVQEQPANDNCNKARVLTSNATCVNTAGTLDLSTISPSVPLGSCTAGSYYDVWYKFQAVTTSHTITLSSAAGISAPRIQIFSGDCTALTSLNCVAGTTLTQTGLTIGQIYIVRIANYNAVPTAASTFNICVTHNNDNCIGAQELSTASTCINAGGTLLNATANATVAACGNVNSAEVWYRFVAKSPHPTITLSNVGSDLNSAGARLQLFSGSCNALVPVSGACGASPLVVPTSTPGLINNSTYYIRVTTNTNTGVPTSGNWGFDICITNPKEAVVDYSKTFINVSKGTTGGTINPGDTLEIRATLVVGLPYYTGSPSSISIRNVEYYDTLTANKGYRLLANNMALRTNEGKLYKPSNSTYFTDATGDDAAWTSLVGADTALKINMGDGATASTAGKINNLTRPWFGSNACIVMATYRVKVTGVYGQKIMYGGGAFRYIDDSTNISYTINFPKDSLAVYQNIPIGTDGVSPLNVVGDEFGGTFGASTGSPTHIQSRPTTATTRYGFQEVGPGFNGPNDYFYSVLNNTSPTGSTNRFAPKADNITPTRSFGVFDITGDHTGAVNPEKGNLPCDINQPISATNPCGYMIAVNASFRSDVAFEYNFNGACSETYYEISAWVKNICYTCGSDSLGRNLTAPGYVPVAAGDSSGVRPNLAFEINGVDYYSTGDILYQGLGAGRIASDTLNKWVRRSFVYKTGLNETSFKFGIRNNAPGGGGNDWVLDDIGIRTIYPTMTYAPPNPITFIGSPLTITDTVRSYFNNYTHYQWQVKPASGSWTNIAGASGNVPTPAYNATLGRYEYWVSYTIPASATAAGNAGDLYRMLVSSNAANLTNGCSYSPSVSFELLPVDACVTAATNYAVAPETGVINWNRLNWSLGHIPTCCESAYITYQGTNTGVDAVAVEITNDICIRNLTLHNAATSATQKIFTTDLKSGFRMYMNGDVRMIASGAIDSDTCIFKASGNNTITVTGNTVIGTPTDNAYSIFGCQLASSGMNNYVLRGDSLVFNNKAYVTDWFTNIKMIPTAKRAFLVNNTNTTPFNTAVTFANLYFGDTATGKTFVLAGSNPISSMNNNAGLVELGVRDTLELGTTYSLNAKGTPNCSFSLRTNSLMRVGGFTNGTTGSNFPANFTAYNLDATSTVEYNGNSGATQSVFGTTYGKLVLTKGTGAVPTRAPKNTNGVVTTNGTVTVNALVDYTLDNNSVANAAFNLLSNAGLHCRANVLSGTGSFTMSNGSFLSLGHAQGITSSGATGNIQVAGTRTYNTASNYTYYGTVNQVTGNGLPSQINNFVIDNPGVVTNSQNLQTNGSAQFRQGVFDLLSTKYTTNGSGQLMSVTSGKIKANAGIMELKGTSGVAKTLSGSWFVGRNISTLINSNTPNGFANSATAGDSLLISHALLYGVASGASITTNNNITLLSRDTGTARFGDIQSNTITGNVVVERYIPATRRWRLLGWPTTSTQTARASLMEGATVPNADPNPGYGCIVTDDRAAIWGPGGFDSRSVSGPSVKYYNSATDTYTGIPDVHTFQMNSRRAYYNFVRGNRLSLPVPYTNSTTILRSVGTLKTGNQAFTIPAGKFDAIGNPYASAVDIRGLDTTGITGDFYLWDPALSGGYGLGAYQLLYKSGSDYRIMPGGGSYGAVNSIVDTIESGSGFFVRARGAGGTVTFRETAKSRGARVFMRGAGTPQAEQLFALLSIVENGEETLVDGTMAAFDNSYSSNVDYDDALKLNNTNENASFKRSNTLLSIERRADVEKDDTLFINLSSLRVKTYKWNIKTNYMQNNGRTGFLIDKYTQTTTALNLHGETPYQFNVVNIPGSYGAARFMIVFKQIPQPKTVFVSVKAIRQPATTIAANNVQVAFAVNNEVNIANYEVEHSEDGINFVSIDTVLPMGNNNNYANYTAMHTKASEGNNWYRIKLTNTGGGFAYSSIVMVVAKEAAVSQEQVPVASINPNPVVNSKINLVLSNYKKGNYNVAIVSVTGQQVYNSTIKVNSIQQSNKLKVHNLAKGIYYLTIKAADGIEEKLAFINQ
jgi:trimeric autotransporter adhesin